jgi:hypothetical protein
MREMRDADEEMKAPGASGAHRIAALMMRALRLYYAGEI